MSIFKTSNIFNRKFNALGISGAEASKEAYDYIIDSVQETNTTSAFVKNTVESVEFAQESTVSSTAPRRIVYGTAVVGGNIVWRVSEETGETQFAIVWAEGCNAVNTILFDGIDVAPSGSYPNGYFGGNFRAESFTGLTGSQNLTDSFLISKKPSYWDGLHYFSGCAYSYIFLRFNSTAFPNGFPSVTAEIEGRRIYDPRKDSTSGSILYNPSLGVSSHRLATSSTWQYDDNAALCLLDYMLDSRLGLGESFDSFDQQSLRDAIDICAQGVTSASGVRKRYTCNGSIFADKSHRENIKQILSTMNGKLIYSNGKYYIKPYAYETPHSQIVDESMIVGAINYSAKQGRADSYNRVKGKFNSLHDGYVVTDYPVQYSGVDADGLTYDDKDGETLYLDYNLPLTTHEEDAQRLARLMMLRSRMQATVTFTANMKALAYKVGDTIQFGNDILGFTSGLEKEFEITDYIIANDTDTGITVQITAKEVVLAIYNWQASDLLDYTANDVVEAWDGRVASVTNVVANVIQTPEQGYFGEYLEVNFQYTVTDQVKHFRIDLNDVITNQTLKSLTTGSTTNLYSREALGLLETFTVSVVAVSIRDIDSEPVASTLIHAFTLRDRQANEYYFPSNNLNQPTEAQFAAYFGQAPQSGDTIIVYTTDSNNAVTDTKKYVFYLELDARFVEHKVIGDRYSWFGTYYPTFPVDIREFFVDQSTFADIDITWSINVTYYSFAYNDTASGAVSQPTFLNTVETRGGAGLQVTSSVGDVWPASYEKIQEKFDYTVTATWQGGSLTSGNNHVELVQLRKQP
jgi:hypothetical protein